jgi:hypothetical protein
MPGNYAQQQMARMKTHASFPYLIKITRYIDEETVEEFRYANSDFGITYNEELYSSSTFTLDPPDKDGGKIGDAQITISAVDQFWIQKIRETQIPARLTFIASIVYGDKNSFMVESIERYEFTLRNVQWNEESITWSLVFDETMGIVVPCDRGTMQKVPGVA